MDSSTLPALTALAVASLGLARARLNASANLIHWMRAHGQGLANAKFSHAVAEIVGLTVMAPTGDAYTANHALHHRDGSVVTLRDPDSLLMWRVGLRPGRSYEDLKRSFFIAPFSWQLHGPMTWDRLRATFGPDQPRWRRAASFAFWGGLAGTALAGGWFGAFVLGGVTPLLLGGNVAVFVQIASEHAHLLAEPKGRARHAALSHGRHLLGWVPPIGAPWWRWLWVPFALAAAVVARLVVIPGPDLGAAHDMHHIGAKGQLGLNRHPWVNAAYEFSPLLWAALAAGTQLPRRFSTIWAAISAWLLALSKEAPITDAP